MKKRCKVFVIPVVILLFVLLPGILLAEQAGIKQHTIDNNTTTHTILEKRTDRKTAFANTSSDNWRIEVVDAPKYFDNFYSRSIAIDNNNNPHIAYGGDRLYYAYHYGSTWNYQSVDVSLGVGSYASISLDMSGKVHISYYDDTNDDLKYATNSSGAWETTMVDSNGAVGKYTSLALDASGKVHISYFDETNYDLKYATNVSGAWITTTVDSNKWVGGYSSIAVDASGKVHISYYYYLKYATNAPGAWVTTTIASDDDTGAYSSIAVDASGKVYISYYSETNYDLNPSSTSKSRINSNINYLRFSSFNFRHYIFES